MSKRLGLVILVVVVAAVAGLQLTRGKSGVAPAGPSGGFFGGSPARAAVTVKGSIGSEKSRLLDDPAVQKLLREKYGLAVDYSRVGSIEMVQRDPAGQDFLWPSNPVALEMFRERRKGSLKSQVIFNSPIVLYSWDAVTEALIKQGIVQRIGDAYYLVQFPKLIQFIQSGKKWEEIGLPDLYGKVTIVSTDPTRSSSGNLFAGLLANLINDGDVLDDAHAGAVIPKVKQFFDRLGYLEPGSDDLFRAYLSKGMGDKPLIVGYEAQLIEFSIENQAQIELLKEKIRTLYPRPTVWSSHPLIALTPNGEKLMAALQDPALQKIAWERHGFRSGLMGVQNDPKVLQVTGVPETISNVMPLPTPKVMERIVKTLSTP
jgi:hypothetical protein